MNNREAVNISGLLVVLFGPALAGIGAAWILVLAAAWLEPIVAGWLG